MSSITAKIKDCCNNDINIVPIDGTHTCIKCGLVLDIFMPETTSWSKVKTSGEYCENAIYEYCERANIGFQTAYEAEACFTKSSEQFKRVPKLPLMAASMYVTCKKWGYHVL